MDINKRKMISKEQQLKSFNRYWDRIKMKLPILLNWAANGVLSKLFLTKKVQKLIGFSI